MGQQLVIATNCAKVSPRAHRGGVGEARRRVGQVRSVVTDYGVNILEPIDGGGWLYRPTTSSTQSSYEIDAADAAKLATGLGVQAADVQRAWGEMFGTSGRQVVLSWLRDNDIKATTRFAGYNTD